MWKTITPTEMKRIEGEAMAQGLCTGEALMNRAAAAVARRAAEWYKDRHGEAICLCGCGNNGGDGLAAMRILAQEEGLRGSCWLMDGKLSGDAQRELDRLLAECSQVTVHRLAGEEAYAASGVITDENGNEMRLPGDAACIIDAMFGTGLSRALEGVAAGLCALSNRAQAAGVPVVAVDIPSGLCGATGKPLGDCIRATETVTFHRPKPGLFLRSGLAMAGKVMVADIGLEPEWDDAEGFSVLEAQELPAFLPPRSRVGHKGTFGRVVLFCGSKGMAGAAGLCATAALRAGAGLVTVACPERILDTVQSLCPCATCLPLPGNVQKAWRMLRGRLASADVLGAGCGLGQGRWARSLMKKLLRYLSENRLPAVLDADALNLLAGMDASAFDLSRCVLTPHPGEAMRLLAGEGLIAPDDAVKAAAAIRAKYGAAVILKGAASVLMTGEGTALNVLGTAALGKGGSGDVLTGVVCALLAGSRHGENPQSQLSLLQAACGMHGLAGMLAEQRFGSRGVLATDVCALLGLAGEGQVQL